MQHSGHTLGIEYYSDRAFSERMADEEKLLDTIVRQYEEIKPCKSLIFTIDGTKMAFVTRLQELSATIQLCLETSPQVPPDILVMNLTQKDVKESRPREGKIFSDAKGKYPGNVFLRDQLSSVKNKCLVCWGNNQQAGWNMICEAKALGYDGKFFYYTQNKLRIRKGPASSFEDILMPVKEIYKHMGDRASRHDFLAALKSLIMGDYNYLPTPPFFFQYAHPLVRPLPGDVVCDAGLCDAGVINYFAAEVGVSGKVYGFEPVKKYLPAIKGGLTPPCSHVVIEPCGLWSDKGAFYIHPGAGGGAKIQARELSPGMDRCEVLSLDSYLEARNERCDLLKLDIEGAEIEALKGAMRIIRKYRPKLQICVYHHPSHYLDIPLMLLRENLGYVFYFCHHTVCNITESVLYAIAGKE